MKTIILPGYSPHNKEWLYDVKNNLEIDGEIVVHEWKHWKEGSLSVKNETDNIITEVGNDRINFIAKSVGFRILMTIIPKLFNKIEKVILCGIPVDPIRYSSEIKMIKKTNLVIFQNSKDPFMSFEKIKKSVVAIDKDIKVFEKIASNHDYPYFEEFSSFLSSSS